MSSKDFGELGLKYEMIEMAVWRTRVSYGACHHRGWKPHGVEGLSQAPSWTLPPANKPRLPVAKQTSRVAVALGKSQS